MNDVLLSGIETPSSASAAGKEHIGRARRRQCRRQRCLSPLAALPVRLQTLEKAERAVEALGREFIVTERAEELAHDNVGLYPAHLPPSAPSQASSGVG